MHLQLLEGESKEVHTGGGVPGMPGKKERSEGRERRQQPEAGLSGAADRLQKRQPLPEAEHPRQLELRVANDVSRCTHEDYASVGGLVPPARLRPEAEDVGPQLYQHPDPEWGQVDPYWRLMH